LSRKNELLEDSGLLKIFEKSGLSAEEILLKKNELLKDINGIEIEKPSI
jgi:hypothetical protein